MGLSEAANPLQSTRMEAMPTSPVTSTLLLMAKMPAALATVYAIWMTILGGCVGSFLNVVIYRVPRGMSIVHPGSHCPKCNHAIRWRHNLPVVGWLMLRGRCFDCRASISARYPLVEALVAGVFLALAWIAPISGGVTLPTTETLPERQLWSMFGYHALLICTLIAIAFIEFDRPEQSLRHFVLKLVLPALVVGLIAPAFISVLHPGAVEGTSPLFNSVLDALIGLVFGLAIGMAYRNPSDRARLVYPRSALAIIGAYLGCAAVSLIAAGCALVLLVLRPLEMIAKRPILRSWSAPLVPLSLVYIATWGRIAERLDPRDVRTNLWFFLLGLGMTAVFSTVVWATRRQPVD